MSHHSHMPPVPPGNRTPKGAGGKRRGKPDKPSEGQEDNPAEQGETANIRQNTTNAGYFHGRRVK